jgi:hypothetical protein
MAVRIACGGEVYEVPAERVTDIDRWIAEQSWADKYKAELEVGRAEAERQKKAADEAVHAKAVSATPAAKVAARKAIVKE